MNVVVDATVAPGRKDKPAGHRRLTRKPGLLRAGFKPIAGL